MRGKRGKLPLLPAYANGEEVFFIQDALRLHADGHSGDHVEKFTEELGDFLGIEGIRLVSNAASALHLVCRLAGLEKGDRVFSSAFLPIELAEPVLESGAELILIDSDLATWNMSPLALEKALKHHAASGQLPKLVIVSHSCGKPARMEELSRLCSIYGVMLVEDATEALGSTYKGKMCGTWGDFGIFCFSSDKMITTSSGGMLVSASFNKLGEELHKAFLTYPTSEMGYTYSMSNILAGMGRAQLRELGERIRNKQKIYQLYKHVLEPLPGVSFPAEVKGSIPNRWLSTMLVNQKAAGISAENVIAALELADIEATLLRKPLHLFLSLKNCRLYSHQPGKNIAELIYRQGIGLPSGAFMPPEEQFRVIVAFRNIHHQKKKMIH